MIRILFVKVKLLFTVYCKLSTVIGGNHLTKRQKKFCEEFLTDMDVKAALARAGYSPKNRSIGKNLMENEEVRGYICELMGGGKGGETGGKNKSRSEIIEFLTAVMRGEIEELKASAKDRMHAAELLGKWYGVFDDKERGEPITIVFSGDWDLK